MQTAIQIKKELEKLKNPKQAEILQRFFKTGKGQYGQGDIFLGIKAPVQRKIAKEFKKVSLKDIEILLNSKVHEHRLISLFILINKFRKADNLEKKKIFDFYLENTKNINNWDLVDISAPKIVGVYLLDKNRKVLYRLARSKDLWQRRIAIMSAFAFIKEGQFKDTLKIARILVNDEHDLIHKAVGWMLREIGKRDQKIEEAFLKKHYRKMPRTMLRYAIEKFSEKKRKFYLKKTFKKI